MNKWIWWVSCRTVETNACKLSVASANIRRWNSLVCLPGAKKCSGLNLILFTCRIGERSFRWAANKPTLTGLPLLDCCPLFASHDFQPPLKVSSLAETINGAHQAWHLQSWTQQAAAALDNDFGSSRDLLLGRQKSLAAQWPWLAIA